MIYLKLFISFFLIGLFTIGGGYAMIPLVRETVISNAWISEEEFIDFIGVCESTPGPIAINMATYVGASQGGLLGGILATIGVVLPSFIIILLIAMILTKFIKNKYVQAFLNGIKPIVIGLITSTGLILVFKVIGYIDMNTFEFKKESIITMITLLIIYFASKFLFKKKINNILLIVFSAFIGIIVCVIL